MPTLHDVTDKTKLLLKWGGITLGAFIAILLLYRGGMFVKNTFFPKKAPPPAAAFGKLDPINFPQTENATPLNYTIDTVTGKLPELFDENKKPRDRIAVHKLLRSELTLLDLQDTRKNVQKTGFTGSGVQISGDIYRFQKFETLPKTLDIDIVTKNFTLSSAFAFNEMILQGSSLPQGADAIRTTTSLTKALGASTDDIDTTKTKIQLLRLKNGVLLDAETREDAQIIRIDYFQNNQNQLPIYYPKGVYSTMYFLVGSSTKKDSGIVLGNFFHQKIGQQQSAYPIKSVQTAFSELKEGKGYIAANFVKGATIPIKEIFLGYYLGNEYEEYLMPIYIFKGREDEFYAYVSAISDDLIKTTASLTSVSEQNK